MQKRYNKRATERSESSGKCYEKSMRFMTENNDNNENRGNKDGVS